VDIASLRARLHQIIFEADTRAGRAFDLGLLLAIVASVIVVMLESVASVRVHFGPELRVLEWAFTILFTVEYALRLFTVHRPLRYAVSVFGLIDLFAILPTYLSIFVPGAQSFLVIRLLRLLRIFRILKLGEYLRESRVLVDALRASRRKIQVFLLSTLTIVVVVGALMYVIEGEEHGFTSIPVSIWAVVTLTTVGYGDLAPETPLGQGLAVLLMLTGYGIIAVPTGIVTAEIARAASATPITAQACPACGLGAHEHDAVYCRKCGAKL
jgi:voltage-gated potassium channel